MGVKMLDYYNILQVKENATQDEIKQAYHKMVRLFHPDNFNGSEEVATEKMTQINEAYETLSDIGKRTVYDADRQLKSGRSNYKERKEEPSNPHPQNHDDVERDEESSDSSKSNYDNPKRNEEFSNSSKPDSVNEDSLTESEDNNSSKKGCSSCLSKILEYVICIGILCFVVNHFNLVDKTKRLLSKFNSTQYISEDVTADKLIKQKPKEVVQCYLEYIKKGKDNDANKLFSADADNNFITCKVAEYNKTIANLYYGFEKDIPTYPLFEEIRNFSYSINSVNIGENEEYVEVDIEIENCDIALIFGLLLETDSDEHILETLSDSEIQKLFRNTIAQHKDACMINTNATFVLKKNQEGDWKIERIFPLKDFSKVIIGQADDLILSLTGQNIDDDSNGYEDNKCDNLYPNYEDNPYARDLLP